MSHVPGEGVFNMPRPVAINRDINRIEWMLREIPDCRLIILDPITAFFGDTSTRSTGNVWKVLLNLSWLAASANLAVLAVSHVRKKEGAAIHSALGSLAFMAAARTAWTIASDPAHARRRYSCPSKTTWPRAPAGWHSPSNPLHPAAAPSFAGSPIPSRPSPTRSSRQSANWAATTTS